ncbi:SIS domain-containing protein [Prolixibacter sp. SD074]|uniref:D-sedoheptulose-7-phosphate isomerase n=1 Tax=Prolixibacter sp. SD074 TaxID=2652391 RepID=UPI00128AB3BA|nr:SIS domain-containing protein [Prolixibacter sp. SD074]GET29895.1 phosphoheptose isomerase [Prolixibacter sp. SD074]
MIRKRITEALEVKQRILKNDQLLAKIELAAALITRTYREGGKVLFCGNGGSAADAQHLAAELSGRFYLDREPLDAEACHVNTSFLTAVANDYDFASSYARYVKASGRKGDVLVGISTSGNSENIVKAMETAQSKSMHTIAMTGENGGKLKALANILLNVPSTDTPRIQEAHILMGHIFCEIVENNLFGQPGN